jgi:uncharacterized delta-60 repeat protein
MPVTFSTLRNSAIKKKLLAYLTCFNLFCTTLVCTALHAQEGSIDPTFSASFSTAVFVAGGLQSDGKVILAGAWSIDGEDTSQGIIRLNSDGSVDEFFTIINSGLSTSSVRQIIIQPDDKILICGAFVSANGIPRKCIARLHANGEVDLNFDSSVGPDFIGGNATSIEAMVLQPDGKIVIGGRFNTYDGQPVANGVIRLNADGSIDNSFNAAPAFGPEMTAQFYLGMDIQSDGKILLGGIFDYGEGAYGDDVSGIVRLNADGSFDESFNTLNLQDKEAFNISDLKVDNLDNVYVIGELWGFGPQFNYEVLTYRFKLNPDGTVNQTHLNNNYALSGSLFNMALLTDWKVMYSGFFDVAGNSYHAVTRTLPLGLFDIMFNNEIPVSAPPNTQFLEQADGKILCYSGFDMYNETWVPGVWRIENTPNSPCGVSFEVLPSTVDDHTLLVVPEYNGFPDLNFLWTYGDGNSSEEMYPYHTYSANGEYELCATLTVSESGNAFCRETFCLSVSESMTSGLTGDNGFSINVIPPNSVGISELNQPRYFEIFPNPSGGEFYLNVRQPQSNSFTVSIANSTGGVVKEKQISGTSGATGFHNIDLRGYPSGVYLVQITSELIQEVHRVVIQ